MNLRMQARLTVVLAAACGVFALLVLLFWLGVGSGYSFQPPDADATRPLPSVSSIKGQDFSMPEFPHFAEITQRPLFSEDRKPIPPDEAGDEGTPEAPPVPLQVKLTGVIITPEVKLAMFKDQTTNKDVSLREGMPLPGNQAVWLLVEIDPRKVVFRNNKDETSEVELEVSDKSGPPSMRVNRTPSAPPPPPLNKPKPGQDDAQKSLRERIEERRKQLREQARKMRAQQQRARQKQQESTR